MDPLKVTRKQIAPVVDATFPTYSGRKFKVVFTTEVGFYDTNWAGGTRNLYTAVTRDGRTAHFTAPAPWINQVEGTTIALPVDVLIVKHGIFCGQDMGLTVYCHPDAAPRLLGAGGAA